MKIALAMLLCLLSLAVTMPAMDVEKSVVKRDTFASLEKGFDGRILSAGADDPFELLGGTRGIYLDGYGAVFTTEVSLIITPTLNPFRQSISKELAESVHQRKLKRLPLLRNTMREMLVAAATSLDTVPPKEQVVVAVRLLYLSWENTAGLPSQIVMKADRAALLKRASMDSVIQTEER